MEGMSRLAPPETIKISDVSVERTSTSSVRGARGGGRTFCVRFNNRPSLLTDRLPGHITASGMLQMGHALQVFGDHILRVAFAHQLAVIDPDGPLAELAHQRWTVRDEDDRYSLVLKLPHLG